MASPTGRTVPCPLKLAIAGLLALLVLSGSPGAHADTGSQRALPSKWVGTWRLTSETLVDPAGTPVGSVYEGTVGKLTYTRRGDVWAIVGPPASSGGEGALWYTGTATVNKRAHEVVHRVRYSSVISWVGTDLVRGFRFSRHGHVLRLTAEITPERTDVLVWRKAR